jgi:arylsulfatase A-like enzyme
VRKRETWFAGTRKDYAAMTEAIDAGVGKLLAALEERGDAGKTLVIFTNDNGGERLSDMGPLFHHKATLWEGGIRVPCLVRYPGALPAGKISDQPAITMDLAATVLSACGVSPPADRKLDGIDLIPLLNGKQAPEARTFVWRIERQGRSQRAVRHDNFKLVRDSGYDQLFDLSTDIGERHDLSYQHPEKADELRQLLTDWEAEMAEEKPAFSVK